MKNMIKQLTLVILFGLFLASNKAFAFEPSVLKAQGRDVVINYPYPVQNILPGKKISFTAEYVKASMPKGSDLSKLDWMGTICGKFVFLTDAGQKASFTDIQMPKAGNSCFVSLTALFQDDDALTPMGWISHKLEFAKPTFVHGTNPAFYIEKYFVQSSIPQGQAYSYWKWRITGCDKGSTAAINQTTSSMNYNPNGSMCKIIMSVIAKYDDTQANDWINNKFVVYSKTLNYNPLD